ncbi:Hint domain-containing protein [Asaia astilbis]
MIYGLDLKTITGVTRGDRSFIIHTTGEDVTIDGYIPTYKFTANGDGIVWLRACFAAGTLVSTPIGSRTVETLKVGDMVDTDLGPQAVQWVGHQDVNLHGATPDEAHLVRIRAHAFGPQSPSRDLWVTSEHCVQNAEGLTPIRMLVNGGSIAYDRQKRRFTYYHIEVANHAILQAENLGMESYLPGSNASLFENGHDESLVVSVMRDGVVRLPLIIDRERVEPLWARLVLRSREMGFPVLSFEGTVGSTDFSLMTDKGETLDRVDHAVPGQAAFLLPPKTKHVRIFSHAVRPDQAIGPFVDDRRLLGLRVGAAYLQGEVEDTKVTDHLRAGILGGWNNIESDDWRWTSDEALLPLPSVAQSGGALRLVLELPDMR